MGFIALLCLAALLAFNFYAVDAMMRMRTDLQVVRKTVAELRKRAMALAPAPTPEPAVATPDPAVAARAPAAPAPEKARA